MWGIKAGVEATERLFAANRRIMTINRGGRQGRATEAGSQDLSARVSVSTSPSTAPLQEIARAPQA